MKRVSFRGLAAGLLVLGFTSGLALATGMFPTLPTVGGSSSCAGYATGTSGQVCTATIPAGPSALTGAETIPMDTNLSSGQAPQTVKAALTTLNVAPISFTTCAAAACGSHTIGANDGGIMLIHSTTIDSATVVTPASPVHGRRFHIGASHTVTSLTVTANTGSSLAVTTPTVLTASTTAPQGYEYVYNSADTKWYRVR